MPDRKKIAAVITSYFPYSHADVIVTKFLKGIPTDAGLVKPRVEIASIYLDQIDRRDIGQSLAWWHGVPIYQSIRAALTLGGNELAVDGVLLIGEHGDYPKDEMGRHMYPRRALFEQICGVFASSGRSVPVFNDKHLSYNWEDARWMYDRAKDLSVPFMAGSSLPLGWRKPFLEYPPEAPVDEALAIGYSDIEAYGYHALETLQCMVERRPGGETGVVNVQFLEGEAVWEAGRQGRWSKGLAEAACAAIEEKPDGPMERHCLNPAAFLIEYRDGLRAAVLMLNGYVSDFAYAGKSRGQVEACEFYLQRGFPFGHFSYLSLNVEEMFVTGQPTYPVERTLLTTGLIDAVMRSRYQGQERLETPHLGIAYRSYGTIPWRPTGPRPSGATVEIWPPR
ncbi:MAG: hypothetical protein IT210_03055 [Armatimonadetes bacterium]|nr:hypothetical protein [Armatimonadota bacterium]